jgi:hypothetical protein
LFLVSNRRKTHHLHYIYNTSDCDEADNDDTDNTDGYKHIIEVILLLLGESRIDQDNVSTTERPAAEDRLTLRGLVDRARNEGGL